MVALGSDGTIVSHGSYSKVLAEDSELARSAAQEEQVLAKVEEEIEEDGGLDVAQSKAHGKLVVKEEVAEGHVSWHACEYPVSNSAK